MKNFLFITRLSVVIYFICLFIVIIGTSCKSSPVEKIVYKLVHDTIIIEDTTKINQLKYDNKVIHDSLIFIKDSLETELFVAKYKLERIKYYNKIAAKGNNIKYLRGWINRVLNN